jgi:hypothetical protein
MGQQLLLGAYAEERVQQPAVAHIHFRGLDLSLGQVFVPRLKLPHDQQFRKQIEVAAYGRFPDP